MICHVRNRALRFASLPLARDATRSFRVRCALPFATLLLAGCASAPRVDVPRVPPGVQLTTRIDFYDIPGTTVSALRADITRSGPRIEATHPEQIEIAAGK